MIQDLCTVKEVSRMIEEGHTLLLAGSKEALSELPAGNWIAGTTPYFMASNRERRTSLEHVFVHQLPDCVTGTEIREYDESDLSNIYLDAPVNGFTVLILPSSSKVAFEYALNAPYYPKFASKPVCGWVAGWHLMNSPDRASHVVSGLNPVPCNHKAVAMHVSLADDKYAEINMFSPFKVKPGHTIMFDYDGLVQDEAIIDGVKHNFAEYIRANGVDTTNPLISNYAGAPVCVSCLKVEGDKVYTYSPVFKGVEYHFSEVKQEAPDLVMSDGEIIYSVSCILNFLQPELCEAYIEKMNGPATFGEVAYQLVNQTAVYLIIGNI